MFVNVLFLMVSGGTRDSNCIALKSQSPDAQHEPPKTKPRAFHLARRCARPIATCLLMLQGKEVTGWGHEVTKCCAYPSLIPSSLPFVPSLLISFLILLIFLFHFLSVFLSYLLPFVYFLISILPNHSFNT